jgi:hypothetical protein
MSTEVEPTASVPEPTPEQQQIASPRVYVDSCMTTEVKQPPFVAKRGPPVSHAALSNNKRGSGVQQKRVLHPDIVATRTVKAVLHESENISFSLDTQPRPYVVVTTKKQYSSSWDIPAEDWAKIMSEIRDFIRRYKINDGSVKFNFGEWNQYRTVCIHIMMDANQYLEIFSSGLGRNWWDRYQKFIAKIKQRTDEWQNDERDTYKRRSSRSHDKKQPPPDDLDKVLEFLSLRKEMLSMEESW